MHTSKIHFGNHEQECEKKITISLIFWLRQAPDSDQNARKFAKICVRVKNTENFLESGNFSNPGSQV